MHSPAELRQLVVAFIGVSLGLGIGALIGGPILRLACLLFNGVAGKTEQSGGVPVPAMSKAMTIVAGISLVQIPITLFVLHFHQVGTGALEAKGVWAGTTFLRFAIAQLVGFFIASAMLSGLLPTGFGRAALVALLWLALLLPLTILALALAIAVVLHWAGVWHPFNFSG